MKKIIITVVIAITFSIPLKSFASDSGTYDKKTAESRFLQDEKSVAASDIPETDLNILGNGMVLIEASTGQILYEKNKDTQLPPASVTKIMTMLLVMEAIDQNLITFDDSVSTSEHAASMGGTQIYLEVGETMTVHELLKAVAVPSANDAAVALAEYISGTEAEFVKKMNERASELGMNHSNFTNCTGLFDDENHYTTAYDLAIATRELIKHEKIFEYTTIWTDSLRNGKFGLANTNKLLRTYSGINGMKTGYTKLAGHCLSGTALRNGMQLISVVLGSPTSQDRFNAVSTMLDYGFSTFSVYNNTPEIPEEIEVRKGKSKKTKIGMSETFSTVTLKGKEKSVTTDIDLCDFITAPAKYGEVVGSVTYKIDDKIIKIIPICITEETDKAKFTDYFGEIILKLFP